MLEVARDFGNVLNLPVFGFGAKTSPFLDVPSQLFPMTRTIRNPFAPNDPQVLRDVYSECLSQLIMHRPSHLTTVFQFAKQLGEGVRKRMARKAQEYAPIQHTVDCFYVLYVISSGVVDDAKELVKQISKADWNCLPVQVHVVALQTDKALRQLQKQFIRVNTRQAKWPQFNLHFFDEMESFYE